MAEFGIGSDLMRALQLRLKMYGDVLGEAADIHRDVVYTETMKRAKASPRWVGVADFIDTWDENDRMWIGVREPQMISEAQAAEYGTEGWPPDPIMRTMDESARLAAARASEYVNSMFGGAVE